MRLRSLCSAACPVLFAACVTAPPPAAPPVEIAVLPAPPAEPPTRLEPREWTPRSPATEIAAWARQGCARAEEGKQPCLERALVGLLDQAGVARTMEVLDTLAATDPEVFTNGHPLAHGLGISAYRSPETVAATFAACPTSQMSGCQHGVIQGYFLDAARQGRPIGRDQVDGLCAPHLSVYFVFYHCVHGMGHGLMAFYGNHLPSALAACGQASEETVRENCYGGAFMENVIGATHPHHSAGGHAQTQVDGHGAHGEAHGGAGHASRHGEWKALDPADPHYPCNTFDARYQDACYSMQPSAIMFHNGGDVAATARACDTAPADVRGTCFVSLGREITAFAVQDHGRTIEMCGRVGGAGGGRGALWCLLGAVGTLMNQSADPQDGIRFCRALQDAAFKRDCYRSVGELVAKLVSGTRARGERCEAAEPEFVLACRRGAGIEPSGRDEE
ncbi:MAG TPA: hypothetical protein VFR37_17035 [Longimicrobium sp.]|nr:hypothetical protein [Longimicrobium sp.]